MKAAVLERPGKLVVKEFGKPGALEGEVLVRVNACAVCGSDLRIFKGEKTIDVPITGHEIAGTIEEMGEGVEGFEAGDRVAIETVVGCGNCNACRNGFENRCEKKFRAIGYQFNGGFAQYLSVPKAAVKQGCVLKLPECIGFYEATFVEPLSCVINGQEFLNIEEGNIVVIGAGIIGLLNAELAAMKRANVILVNRSLPRLELAKQVNARASHYIDSSKENAVERVMEITKGRGADAVICACSAKEPQQQALQMAAVGADISYFAGISKQAPTNEIDTNLIHYRELHVHGANSSNRKQYLEAIDLIASKKIEVEKFITNVLPLSKINEAMEIMESRDKNALKIVIDPWK